MQSDNLKRVLEKLEGKQKAIRVDYFNPSINEAELYYFYYNKNSDPCVVHCPCGEKITEEYVGISLPSSVHMDYDLRPDSKITESELARIIKAYKILTENVLRKNVENGKVIRKRVTTIEKPKTIKPLVNKVKGKQAGLYAQTAVARVKRKRSNNVRDILNLDKQAKKDKSVLEIKENTMNLNDFTRRPNKLNETYCTYPQAKSIAANIVDAMYKKTLPSYSIKFPSTGLAKVDQRGFSIEFGMTNKKYVAREALEDAIAKDILGRFSRGEQLDADVRDKIALGK